MRPRARPGGAIDNAAHSRRKDDGSEQARSARYDPAYGRAGQTRAPSLPRSRRAACHRPPGRWGGTTGEHHGRLRACRGSRLPLHRNRRPRDPRPGGRVAPRRVPRQAHRPNRTARSARLAGACGPTSQRHRVDSTARRRAPRMAGPASHRRSEGRRCRGTADRGSAPHQRPRPRLHRLVFGAPATVGPHRRSWLHVLQSLRGSATARGVLGLADRHAGSRLRAGAAASVAPWRPIDSGGGCRVPSCRPRPRHAGAGLDGRRRGGDGTPARPRRGCHHE